MADQDTSKTYVRETRTTEASGNSMVLIVGGLVVAVGFILWFIFGGPGPVATTDPVSDTTNVTIAPSETPSDTTTNVTIDPTPAPAEPTDPVEPAPADDAAEPATPTANP